MSFNGYISSRVCLLLRHRSPRLSNPNLEKFSWKVCCRTGPSRPLSALHTRVSTLTQRTCPFPNPDDWKITPIWAHVGWYPLNATMHCWAIKYCDHVWARELNLCHNKAVELTKWCYYIRLLYQKRINALSASWMCLVLDPENCCYACLQLRQLH